MNCDGKPCPREELVPSGAPSAVEDDEHILRVIVRAEWLNRTPDGTIIPNSAAFPQKELQRKQNRTVSVIRSIASFANTFSRAEQVNRQPEWTSDPVIAKASVSSIRALRSDATEREACVLADPDHTTDPPFLTHASVVRACPLPADGARIIWHDLRLELAAQFEEVIHLSGKAVEL
jgi:hypothetical protein